MTRAEIEEKLIAIVRKEKDVPDDKLSLETPLADAGIDSLDALTILFAIEEEFHISIPDDRARSMKTIVTIAGNGTAGFLGDGGAATAAQLNDPYGLKVDAAGTIYIADRGNNRIRVVAAIPARRRAVR